ncbi:hypothetical protein HF313_19270 [Massilia atriviolacea]|uniref:HNH endonuclease n=1 Tax=Massilia atriviolacea TaxID=2495579 RepID=A0A430HSR4_9BURK|nr:hypothetical protein [Massilia atriviolacea]RSZ60593.1 hypothetical protein EJB06_00115 [Massilia atriviolacea]
MIVHIGDVWENAERDHAAYVADRIDAALKSGSVTSDHLLHLLKEKREIIACGTPAQLDQLIHYVNGLIYLCNDAEGTRFFEDCAALFNYDHFSKKRDVSYKKWNAYKLCKTSKYVLCPYCHQNFAFTIISDGKSFRPTLDHFYPKFQYPYLAISLYNLVPACQVCNSSLKGDLNFFYVRHLHPLHVPTGAADPDEGRNHINFDLDPERYIEMRRTGEFDMVLKIVPSVDAAVNNSIRTFLLNERFSIHESTLKIFIRNLENWTPARISEVAKIFGGEGFVFDERHALGFNLDEYKNEVLGKIKKDLYEVFRRPKASSAPFAIGEREP